MGETIPEGDSKAAADAIVSLFENDDAPEPRFDEYRESHNHKQLDRSFARILGLIGKTTRSPTGETVTNIAATPA